MRLQALSKYYEVVRFAERKHALDIRSTATGAAQVHKNIQRTLQQHPRLRVDPHLTTAFFLGPWVIELEAGKDVALNAERIRRELEKPVAR